MTTCRLLLLSLAALATSLRGAEYTFGDEMASFVNNEVGPAARSFLPGDLSARSLNGFVVTLDKARVAANEATRLIAAGESTLLEANALYTATFPSSATQAPVVSKSDVAKLAAAASRMSALAESAAAKLEMVRIARGGFPSLERSLTYEEFLSSPLCHIPLSFIMGSLTSSPNFDYTLAINVQVSGPNTGSENAKEGGFFLFDLWRTDKERDEYKKQMDRFRKAVSLIPKKIPSSEETYSVYQARFTEAYEIYKEEVVQLAVHLDDLEKTLLRLYEALDGGGTAISNGLLSDRVRAAFEQLATQDFSAMPAQRDALLDAALTIGDTSSRIEHLKALAERTDRVAVRFTSLEDIRDSSEALADWTARVERSPIYKPLHSSLVGVRAWSGRCADWASSQLLAGADAKHKLSLTGEEKNAFEKVARFAAEAARREAGNVAVADSHAFLATPSDDFVELSISLQWPGGGSGPHHSAYPRGGSEVWSRGTDGAFARDFRNPGAGRVNDTRTDLLNRTNRNDAFQAAALIQARSNAAPRAAQVQQQRAPVRRALDTATNVRATLPGRAAPITQHARYNFKALSLEDRHRRMDSGYSVRLSIERARQDLLITRERHTPDAVGAGEYRRLHGEYLKAAEAFYRANHPGEAREFEYSAIAIRAWLSGFATSPVQLARFDALRPLETLIETLAQKFPLERPIGPADLSEEQPLFTGGPDRIAACNRRSAEVLELIYGYSGFHNPSSVVLNEVGPRGVDLLNEDGRPVLRAQGILKYVLNHPEEWRALGAGTSAEALSESQRMANLGIAVIAVSMTHVAVVMPGELRSGGSFGNLVPNVYNSVLNRPESSRSYYYGPLNYAWSNPAEVQFFALWDR